MIYRIPNIWPSVPKIKINEKMYYERKAGYLLFLIQEKQINLKIINSIGQMISDLYTFTPMGPIPGPPPPLKQVLFY